ncbi:uncharacterized protein LOC111906913 [Lactuca sativa]|uniref:uncharacterized protein LOC111906913 n=1 Tax=Lactuca sativa TaxID=4236 RepID=UPI000CD85AC8|nr:uncharacterized protein LOC111906913 [Lactuca sativa]
MQYTAYNKKGYTAGYCKASIQQNNQPNNAGESQACYGCGETVHFKRKCPKANNRNAGGTSEVLAIGHEEDVKDLMVVTGTFLFKNIYACILFDSGTDRNFVSHKCKHLLSLNPQKLNETFMVEMANGKNETTNEIFIGCMLTLNNHSFQINLMPVTIGSFDVIISMDWLSPNSILCVTRRSSSFTYLNDETLIIYGDKLSANLRLISCIKAQKCLHKKNPAFVAHVVDKEKEESDIKDIPKVRDFPDVFPEDLLGIPPNQQVKFRINLIPRATPIAKSPYRLAPAEMQELFS